jgi:hypothetical protein
MGEPQATLLHTGMLQRWLSEGPLNVQAVDVSTGTQCSHTATSPHVYTPGHLKQANAVGTFKLEMKLKECDNWEQPCSSRFIMVS